MTGDPAFWPDSPEMDTAKLNAATGTIPFVVVKGCTDKNAETYNSLATLMVTSMCEYKCYAKCFNISGGSDVPSATTGALPTCASAGRFDMDAFAAEGSDKNNK